MHARVTIEGRSFWARLSQTYLVRKHAIRTGRSPCPERLLHLGAAELWESNQAKNALAALISTGDYSHLISSGVVCLIKPKRAAGQRLPAAEPPQQVPS